MPTATLFDPILAFREAEALPSIGNRVEAVRTAAVRFRHDFVASGMPDAVRTCDLITIPYMTEFAFRLVDGRHPSPYLWFVNRMHVIRWRDADGTQRTLLFNPTDHERAAEVPFYKRMRQQFGEWLSMNVLSQRHGTVLGHLARLGIAPGDVDYVAFDHLHTQDLRRLLGPDGWLPKAKLLVQRAEWRIYDQIHPLQEPWYIPLATDGIDANRVVLLDGDVQVGPGVALLATPGHTWGNHSLAIHTPRGVTVISENGVCLDNYAPHLSKLPGMRAYAALGQEVVLNGNSLEGSLHQYTSMIKEKTVAGPHPDDPRWPNFQSSSEMTAHLFAPGLAPTLVQTPLHHGAL